MTTVPPASRSFHDRVVWPQTEEERLAVAAAIAFTSERTLELALKTVEANLNGAEREKAEPIGSDVYSRVSGPLSVAGLRLRQAALENYLQALRSHTELSGLILDLANRIAGGGPWTVVELEGDPQDQPPAQETGKA